MKQTAKHDKCIPPVIFELIIYLYGHFLRKIILHDKRFLVYNFKRKLLFAIGPSKLQICDLFLFEVSSKKEYQFADLILLIAV